MTKIILAEKPSVAKKIAFFLSTTKPRAIPYKRGRDTAYYYVGKIGNEDLFVVPAAGHLYGLDTNEQGYNYPVYSIEWKRKYEITDPKGKKISGYQYTRAYEEMIRVAVYEAATGKKPKKPPEPEEIRDAIIGSSAEIYVATDFDREGETIAYTILKYSLGLSDEDIKKKVKRMKFSAITAGDIRRAFENPINFQFSLAEAGEARHKIDWIWGINLSRALTNSTKSAKGFIALSTGRVQGPTLKLVVDREKEIENFKPKDYYFIKAICEKDGIKFEARHTVDKFWEEEKAKKVLEKIKGKPLRVDSISKSVKNKNPSPPFDLTTLQKEAYRIYGFSPKKTLDIAQKLYERGYITYPRTDSQKLPKKDWKKVLENFLERIDIKPIVKEILEKTDLKPVEGKKDDPAHKAIHPTGQIPKDLSPDEEKIYTLVLKRFLGAFLPPAKIATTKVFFEVEGEKFVAISKEVVDLGYLKAYNYDTPTDLSVLPSLKKGDVIENVKYRIVKEKTKPPSRYSLSSLIAEMERLGLGTKATRGDIIDTLYKRGYITGKSSIRPTPLGRKVVETLEKYAPEVVSPELTASLERELDKIQSSAARGEDLVKKTIKIINPILEKMKESEVSIGESLISASEKVTENRKGGAKRGQNKRYKKNFGKRRTYNKRR